MKHLFVFLVSAGMFAPGQSFAEVLVSTEKPGSMRINGGSNPDKCDIQINKREFTLYDRSVTPIGEIPVIRNSVSLGVYWKEGEGKFRENRRHLFSIDEDGSLIRDGIYTDQTLRVNKLTPEQKIYDAFTATDRKIYLKDASSKMNDTLERITFKIKLKDNDLTKISRIEYHNGINRGLRLLLAVPAAIFGADNHGNDIVCNF